MKKILTITFIFFIVELTAQDIHSSQVINYGTEVNPSLAGVDKLRCIIAHRKQWNSFNSGFRSSYLGADIRLVQSKGGYIGGGLMLLSDQAGSGISLNSAAIHLSSVLMIGKNNKLGIGITGKADQRSFNLNASTWDMQFNGLQHDPGLPSGESGITERKTVPDFGTGIIWKYKKVKNSFGHQEGISFTAGFSVQHLNRANIAFHGEDRQHTRMNAHVHISCPVQLISVQPVFYYSVSGPLTEAIGGFFIGYASGTESSYTTFNRSTSLSVGILYRYKEAFIPAFQFQSGNWTAGLTYDITISRLKEYSRRGGAEVYLSFKDAASLFKKKNTGRRSI